MKRIALAQVLVVALLIMPLAALAKDVPLEGMGAQVHEVVGNYPGAVEVIAPYDRAIKIVKLGKDDVGYWVPEGGKYVIAGGNAYLWCKVFNTKQGTEKYHWIAVNTPDLHKALALATSLPTGVAMYKITARDASIVMDAVTYDAVRAAAEGKTIVDVKE